MWYSVINTTECHNSHEHNQSPLTSEIGLNIESLEELKDTHCSVQLGKWLMQETIDSTGEETFANELMLAKLLRELKSTLMRYHKVHWFFSYACKNKFAVF